MSGPTEQPWQVILLRPAERYVARLPRPERERVLLALRALQEDPFRADVVPLQGEGPDAWRLRIGRYRARLRLDRDRRRIVVTAIGPRGDFY